MSANWIPHTIVKQYSSRERRVFHSLFAFSNAPSKNSGQAHDQFSTRFILFSARKYTTTLNYYIIASFSKGTIIL